MELKNKFLPVFSVDRLGLLNRLKNIEGNYGILAPISSDKNLLRNIRDCGKPIFIDSGVFSHQDCPWYNQIYSEYLNNRWVRSLRLASEKHLRQKVQQYLDNCDKLSPEFVFTQDIFEQPLLSLYMARLTREEYCVKQRNYTLIGVVQVGYSIYNCQHKQVPDINSFPPHYESPKSFLASLISAYRDIGYDYIALGGLLKVDKTRTTGLKFGLSVKELDELLTWSRPEFVLGGLALTRAQVLKKHNVSADSTGWLWWNEKYDSKFRHRNGFQEVLELTAGSDNTTYGCNTHELP
ncbi:hypothetical protein G7B40_011875 [Aetokthonos hydrillicola Thurmond2011]|uniref:Uncharacterized protein n=2 Tax=Aetokthonos TaxID=1550243 RepID=A0AAP5IA35_9CYAN|nr:hypothetical protein [Aetokthonos hydrillicola]MBO3459110.1 hypothetical protein [Aetokthonos hydrillicola CCALA 1050]MBW4584716.1 hypothetical protein [Aetokthonos hydrillicola CCALA 1050]MDR9895260.1 hypothetical protein [Aetokthonos hydrillicola Thurmond2011]